ncbi:hypothetical protein BRD17_01245 [Halobacteriales archaeon SW_7_68_16]|nr:MAG: hypothetical protein BRD17_01245 [Halobacteriales archaeon SW_7_68_16]
MPDPSRLRDSTQIVLPCEALDGVRDDLSEEFVVTILNEGGQCRIVGSPVEIKQAGEFLARHGIPLP